MTQKEIREKIEAVVKEYYKIVFSENRKGNIPPSGKLFDEKELINGVNAVLDGWWTEGHYTRQFEEKFKEFLSLDYVSVVNSGSSANLVALTALTSEKLGSRRIKKGDEVITLAAGFPTTVNPIIQNNLVPVFADVDINTLNIELDSMKKALSSKTKAIMIAHTLGNPFNIKKVKEFCTANNLWLIEDCCDALGSKYRGKYVSTFGDIATFSFYPAHQITMGEGGAVVTNNPMLNRIINSVRDWGRDCWCDTGKDNTCGKRFQWKLGELPHGYDHKYTYSELGYNLKATDMQAAIGCAQLDKLQEFILKRQENHRLLNEGLNQYKDLFHFQQKEGESEPCWFGFAITLKENVTFTREKLIRILNSNNIGTRLLFAGNITKQPYFVEKKINYRISTDLKNTDNIMRNTFWIGVAPLLSRRDIGIMIEKIKEFICQ